MKFQWVTVVRTWPTIRQNLTKVQPKFGKCWSILANFDQDLPTLWRKGSQVCEILGVGAVQKCRVHLQNVFYFISFYLNKSASILPRTSPTQSYLWCLCFDIPQNTKYDTFRSWFNDMLFILSSSSLRPRCETRHNIVRPPEKRKHMSSSPAKKYNDYSRVVYKAKDNE